MNAPAANQKTGGAAQNSPALQDNRQALPANSPALQENAQVLQGNQAQNANGSVQQDFFDDITQSPWFGNPSVRQQLGLPEAQFNQLNQNYSAAYTQYSEAMKQLRSNTNVAERRQMQNALRQRFQQQFGQNVDTALTDQAMRNRFNQLAMQYQGYNALNNPTIQQQLRLTPQQQQQFAQYNQEWNQQMQTLSQVYRSDPLAAIRQYRQLRQQLASNFGSTLTPAQADQWSNLTGQPFNLPASAYFGNGNQVSTNWRSIDEVQRGTSAPMPGRVIELHNVEQASRPAPQPQPSSRPAATPSSGTLR